MNEKALSLKSPKLLTGITNEDFDEQPQQLDTQTQSLEDACSEVETTDAQPVAVENKQQIYDKGNSEAEVGVLQTIPPGRRGKC